MACARPVYSGVIYLELCSQSFVELLKFASVSDLARVPHALDLSSPNMAASVNAALKPLETLSKIVNQPSRQEVAIVSWTIRSLVLSMGINDQIC